MTKFFSLFSAAALCLLLSSCVYDLPIASGYPSGAYPSGAYPSGYGQGRTYQPTYHSGYGHGYGSGYRSSYGHSRYASRCSSCGYTSCRCSRGHGSSHRSHDDPGKKQYRIISGDLDGKKKPSDFHSLDWYHSRGYSLKDLKIETEKGTVIDKRPSSKKRTSKKR